ncbi:NifB/NifX family molybdenum-iron cluster-binding protein [Candidatus Bathyarchaeota archaeon]|nr:NifB/NifX family molybdenum-iron cluster-binding protein [Candidatus Bathyarchaeota archaeon]
MKVAVTTSGEDLSGPVEPHFGRCPRFIVVDTETMEFEIVPNTAVTSAHGAGIAAAQLVASKGVKAILTGNVGPNAYSALSSSGIKMVTGVSGTVGDAVKRFNSGELQSTSGPTVGGHFGTGGRGGEGRHQRF